MNRFTPLLLIFALWLLSEILIGLFTHSKSSSASDRDRKSLRVLWLTIVPAITLGIWVGLQGIGFIPALSPIAFPLGLALIALGLLIRWWAIFTLRKYFTSNVTIREDHQLITSGLYGVIRHPAYAGALLSFLGLGMVFSNWLSLLIILVPIFLAFRYRIQVEEAALQEAFGQSYERYRRRTRKLIPGLY
ncbi:MAG: isoprenylcysteine carboxylmethyltransferase family protein [Calditrichaeota bacterium]|nr:MAG: isoprenylcysteine carboxylmethyltransferase family protein [Calditrichota bacterium]